VPTVDIKSVKNTSDYKEMKIEGYKWDNVNLKWIADEDLKALSEPVKVTPNRYPLPPISTMELSC
jgi:hypothetical protein